MSDEAQAADAEQPPDPPAPPPAKDEPFANAYDFGIELEMGATVTINGQNWIKPAAKTHINWRVHNGILPGRAELELAMVYMQDRVINPVLSEMIDELHRRVADAQVNR